MNVRQIWCVECKAPPGEWCRGIPKQRNRTRLWHASRARHAHLIAEQAPTDPRPLAQRIADFNAEQERSQ